MTLIEKIVLTLQELPEPRLQQVLDFARFLSWQGMNSQSDMTEEPLLAVAGLLSGEPLTVSQIDEELYN